MTLSDGIYAVLKQAGTPLNYREITQRGVDAKLLSAETENLEGVINARLSAEVRSRGSRFVRTARGVYALAEWGLPAQETVAPETADSPGDAVPATGDEGAAATVVEADGRTWTPVEILDELRELAAAGEVRAPLLRRERPGLYAALLKEYHSLGYAMKAAGRFAGPAAPVVIPDRDTWTAGEILMTVRHLPKDVTFYWLRTSHPKFYEAVKSRYKSLGLARKTAEETVIVDRDEPEPGAGGAGGSGNFFTVKTFKRRERDVAEAIRLHAKNRGHPDVQVVYQKSLEQYIFVNAPNANDLYEWTRGVPGVIKVVGEAPREEVERFLDGAPAQSEVQEGDRVMVTAGPFKGKVAVVRKIYLTGEKIPASVIPAGDLPDPSDVEAEFRAYYAGQPAVRVQEPEQLPAGETLELEIPGEILAIPVRVKRDEVRPVG